MADLFTERQQHYNLAVAAMSSAALQGRTLADCVGEDAATEVQNLVSSIDFARKKDTPAKEWWRCEPTHPAIARALKIDRTQMGGVYALAPFRLYHDGEKHLILSAYPCPRILGPIDMDWLGIETVFAWNPIDNTAEVLGDHTPGLFGADLSQAEKPVIFSDPREFFTQWMIDRAAHYVRLQKVRGKDWHTLREADQCPGALAIGQTEKIQWTNLPRDFEARGFDTRKLNQAILRQANLPRAFSGQNRTVA